MKTGGCGACPALNSATKPPPPPPRLHSPAQAEALQRELAGAHADLAGLPDLRRRAERSGRVVSELRAQVRDLQAANEALQVGWLF
jgi:hypothetical protein